MDDSAAYAHRRNVVRPKPEHPHQQRNLGHVHRLPHRAIEVINFTLRRLATDHKHIVGRRSPHRG